MEPIGRGEWLRRIRRKLVYGVPPLTLSECRQLYTYATGDTIEARKRCLYCRGEGKVDLKIPYAWLYVASDGVCRECNGTGYIVPDRERSLR